MSKTTAKSSVEEQTIETISNSEDELNSSSETVPLIEAQKPIYNTKLIVRTLFLGSLLSSMDGTIVANIMVPISASFEQEELKQWIATSFLITNTAFQPLYGKVSDIVGRKYALLFGQFFFGLGCLLCSLSNSVPQFAISRAISGIGGGGLVSLVQIIMTDIIPIEERGIYQGYANVIYATGQVLGAPVGSWALATIGWRWAFSLQAPLIILLMILTYRNINVKNKEHINWASLERIDFGGSFTLVTCIISFLLLFSSKIEKAKLLIVMAISFSAFIYIEKYVAKERVVSIEQFKGQLGGIFIVSFFFTFDLVSLFFGLPVFLQTVQNQSVAVSGSFLTIISFPISFGSLSAGYSLKRNKGSNIRRLSTLISFLSFIVLALAYTVLEGIYSLKPNNPGNTWKIILCCQLVIFGFAYGHVLVSTLITLVSLAGPEGQATAAGLNYLFRSIGQVLGTGISLSLFEHSLENNLSVILKDVPQGSYILKKLLQNGEYLKTSHLINEELREKLLVAFQKAMCTSFQPALVISYLAVIAGTIMFFRRDAK